MATFHQSRHAKTFLQQQEGTGDKTICKSHHAGPHEEIEEELNNCEEQFLAKISQIIEHWKAFSMQNYQLITSKLNRSLLLEINKVICEQIKIEKQQITKLIDTLGQQILLKAKQNADESLYSCEESQKTRALKKQKSYSLLKTRSISGQNSRRKLSKGNFFAEAKKVNLHETMALQHFSKTNPAAGFGNRNEKEGSKIKKNRKKQENCFQVLQRCNSNTSPSNFMLKYISAKEETNSNELIPPSYLNFPCKNNLKLELNGKQIDSFPQQKAALNPVPEQSSNAVIQTKTYQMLMTDFQEKISKKLDNLVNKYTIIQEKLEKNNEANKVKDEIKIYQRPIKVNKPSISIEASLVSSQDELAHLPQAPLVSLQQINFNEQTLKQGNKSKINKKRNVDESTTKESKEDASKKAVKSVDVNNKIIKNKTKVIQNFEESLQEISLPESKKETKEKSSKDLQAEKRLQDLRNDKIFYEKLILEFYTTTQQTILPITKDLLYIIVSRYEDYCVRNNMQKNEEILRIQRGKLEPVSQYKKILQKLPKFVDLKCQKSKKQKMVAYLEKFVEVIYCHNPKENTIQKQWKKLSDSELKQKAQQLSERITFE